MVGPLAWAIGTDRRIAKLELGPLDRRQALDSVDDVPNAISTL
jgi:hypothetical protein